MTTVRRRTTAAPAAVWRVLADGSRYAEWVVGAKRIRAVDDTWPVPGSHFDHAVGVGPIDIEDSSVCEAVDDGRAISLRAKAFPAGAARVRIVLRDGEILMQEHPIEGPARRFDNPALRAVLAMRNRESLRRLARLAEREGRRMTHQQVVDSTAETEATMRPQSVPVNMYETSEAVVVIAPLPAVQPSDVCVEIRDGRLRFWSHVRSAGPREYLVHEWEYGGYERELELPAGFGAGLDATLTNGQLAVRVLKGEPPAEGLSINPAPLPHGGSGSGS